MILDRIKSSLARLSRGNSPGLDYLALYRAQVNAQSADGKTLDVTPDDSRLPPMAAIPLRHGLPGITAKVQPGCYVLVGWWNGDPSKPYVALWESGESVTELTIVATMVNVGGTGGDALVKKTEFANHTHSVPGAGLTASLVDGSVTGSATSATPSAITGTTNMKGK